MARQAVAQPRTSSLWLARDWSTRRIRRYLKRGLDIAVAGIGLLLVAPFLLAIALAIRIESPGRAMFRQRRIGLHGRTFGVYKFRTMIDGADELKTELRHQNGHNGVLFKLEADPRITRVGRFLRRFSLDELPQLLNVVRGEMSLVGPRPLPVEDCDFELDGMRTRLVVRPGLTGLWQVSGRSLLTDEEMIHLDHTYIARWSLALDATIVLRTIPAVISGRGAY